MDLNKAIREVNLITFLQEKATFGKMTHEERIEYERPFLERFNNFYGANKKFFVTTEDGTKIHMDWSNHAKARYVERLGGTENENILSNWLVKLANACKDKASKEYLVYSRSKRLGAIVQPYPSKKRIRIITVLPPFKNRPDDDTELVLAEEFDFVANLGIEILEVE